MESPELLSSVSQAASDSNDFSNIPKLIDHEDFTELQAKIISDFQKPNLPNVNVAEKIIICFDACCDDELPVYRLGDGTSFTLMNMMKRILDFFLFSKHAINKRTEFALLILKGTEPVWLQNFTNNLKDIVNVIDYIKVEEPTSASFDFKKVFQLLNQKVVIPDYKMGENVAPPPYVVRMIVLYGRSNCVPVIPHDDPLFNNLKKQFYFYVDILLAHDDECAMHKCEEIYDALQDLDNGYSYVYEVSVNATKIHDCMAKLLAHPLQRPLQKDTDYNFGIRYG